MAELPGVSEKGNFKLLSELQRSLASEAAQSKADVARVAGKIEDKRSIFQPFVYSIH